MTEDPDGTAGFNPQLAGRGKARYGHTSGFGNAREKPVAPSGELPQEPHGVVTSIVGRPVEEIERDEPAVSNLRQESDKMMDEAEKQQAAMPKHGEPVGGG